MDSRKLLRLVGSLDNFGFSFSSKRKVITSFRACVIASLIVVSMFFFNHPSKTALLHPVLHGFNGIVGKPTVFPCNTVSLPNGSDSSVLLKKQNQADLSVIEMTHETSLDSIDEEWVKSHEENLSEKGEKTSFFVYSTGKGTEETDDNFSDSRKDSSFSSEEVRRGGEKRHQESVISQVNIGTFSGEKAGFSVNTHNEESMETSRNDSFELGIDNINVGSVFGEVEEGVSKKNHEKTSTQESSVASSDDSTSTTRIVDYSKTCDIFDGRWVRDQKKPYYPAGSCPHIDRDFDCHLNGRPDDDFLGWRWQPNQCNIPRLNATDFLERLRGKRLVFVGDSLNRNMWESMVCILRHSVPNKKRVYEISGKREFKKKGFYAFRFEDYNCTVDFVATTFLVRETSFNTRKGSLDTLRLDLMDLTTSMYRDADIIVFNTGHWWTHTKTSKGANYYQEGNYVYPKLESDDAYKRALTTWARWIENNIDAMKTQVFFRGYSLTHFSRGQWNSGGQCHTETEPILNDSYLSKYPLKMKVLEQVLDQMNSPVMYMNISKLTDYRKDAHPSIYRKEYKTVEEKIAAEKSQDCSHWCLPGVPDTWNELLYAYLLRIGKGSWRI